MSSKKCARCGMVNFIEADICKRCKGPLNGPSDAGPSQSAPEQETSVKQTLPTELSYSNPNLITCPHCNHEISRDAATCPQCGCRSRLKAIPQWERIVLLLLLLGLLSYGYYNIAERRDKAAREAEELGRENMQRYNELQQSNSPERLQEIQRYEELRRKQQEEHERIMRQYSSDN